MKSLLFPILCFFLVGLCSEVLGQTPTRARTETGKEVLLYPDGTWKQVEEVKPLSSRPGTYDKPASAQKVFKSKTGVCGIWLDESKWKSSSRKSLEESDFEFMFEHTAGDAYAGVIIERIAMPLSGLKQTALEALKETHSNVKVISEEKRVVNGHEVLCLIIETTINQIPLTFYNYYYAGKAGSIQLVTWTGTNLFDEYKQDLTNFLNGLELYK